MPQKHICRIPVSLNPRLGLCDAVYSTKLEIIFQSDNNYIIFLHELKVLISRYSGSGYLFETTFRREAISDLTGERGSLMGAIQGLFLAQYEVLRENGHTPSEAFNETVEELTQSLMPLFAAKGMDWMYANCSTTAQRGALDWMTPFHDAVKPVMQRLYASVKEGAEAQKSIDANSAPDYREKLNEELRQLRESEMWRTAETVRRLRPENE